MICQPNLRLLKVLVSSIVGTWNHYCFSQQSENFFSAVQIHFGDDSSAIDSEREDLSMHSLDELI